MVNIRSMLILKKSSNAICDSKEIVVRCIITWDSHLECKAQQIIFEGNLIGCRWNIRMYVCHRIKTDGRVAAVNTSYIYLWNSSKKHLKYARGYCKDIWSTFLPWHVALNQNNNKFRANVLCKYLEILNVELNQFCVCVLPVLPSRC